LILGSIMLRYLHFNLETAMHNFNVIQGFYNYYLTCSVSTAISSNETMNNEWYFPIGRSAVEVVVAALFASNLQNVDRVLDLPCGHGRVLRHLVHLFPNAQFDACDLDTDGVDFCASTFGANPIYSRMELTELDFGACYDLIWVGSLFTHTSEEIMQRWLKHLTRFLNAGGIIVATLHGRWCEEVHKVSPYIGEERWREILYQYHSDQYAYADYAQEESHEYIADSYGISLAKPHNYMKLIQDIPGVRIYSYIERAWADHQDVVVVGRPAYNLAWPASQDAE